MARSISCRSHSKLNNSQRKCARNIRSESARRLGSAWCGFHRGHRRPRKTQIASLRQTGIDASSGARTADQFLLSRKNRINLSSFSNWRYTARHRSQSSLVMCSKTLSAPALLYLGHNVSFGDVRQTASCSGVKWNSGFFLRGMESPPLIWAGLLTRANFSR
jgi:hypothetical protein